MRVAKRNSNEPTTEQMTKFQIWQVLRLLQKEENTKTRIDIIERIGHPDTDLWDLMETLREKLIDEPFMEECGCCGCYHRKAFHGDCRTDHERM